MAELQLPKLVARVRFPSLAPRRPTHATAYLWRERQPRATEQVTVLIPIPSPGVPIYRGESGSPLVIVVHDYYGRLPELERFADALALAGFFVAVPDLYNGVATTESDEADTLMDGLDVGIALAELDDIITDARVQGSDRVAVVGFSLGGWLALLHAQGGSVDAAVAYYASLGPKDHGVVPAPVLLHYAELDEWGDGDDPASFIDRLHEHGTPVTDHVYLGTEHSFANAAIDDRYNLRAAELAFARTEKFLSTHLLSD
jgi:carboxymethylenebutenolidase